MLLCRYHTSTVQTSQQNKIKLSKTTTTTVFYLMSNVFTKATTFPLWRAMDSRRITVMHLPISWIIVIIF